MPSPIEPLDQNESWNAFKYWVRGKIISPTHPLQILSFPVQSRSQCQGFIDFLSADLTRGPRAWEANPTGWIASTTALLGQMTDIVLPIIDAAEYEMLADALRRWHKTRATDSATEAEADTKLVAATLGDWRFGRFPWWSPPEHLLALRPYDPGFSFTFPSQRLFELHDALARWRKAATDDDLDPIAVDNALWAQFERIESTE